MIDPRPFWIALARVPGVGPVMYRALCDRFGGPEEVLAAGDSALDDVPGLRDETRSALRDSEQLVHAAEHMTAVLADRGVAVVTYRDERYPRSLLDLSDPPPLLYTLGQLPDEGERTFSISGAAAPSARGADIARAVGRELARAGWTTVSGYALGVDTAAHLGALEENGRTVVAPPMGILAFDLRPEFEPFRERLGGDLIVVSEFEPNDEWSSRNAVMRDRIIAALGRGLLAVEARPVGGTMITFEHALRLGRPSYVVKYRDPPPTAAGNALAIEAGGLPVESLGAFRALLDAEALPRAVPRATQGELF